MSFSGIAHSWPLRAPTSILLAEPFQFFFAFQLRSKYETPIVHTGTTVQHQVCTYYRNYTLLDRMHAQLRSVPLYIVFLAQQRSVAPCGAVRSRAVRCRALRCGVVSLRCVLSFENRAVSTGYNACCIRSTTFPLFSSTCHVVFDLSRSPVFSPHANYPHTADQTPVTKAHSTAEHNWAICSAQAALGIIKSLFAPNYGSLLSAPFTYVFSCLVRA